MALLNTYYRIIVFLFKSQIMNVIQLVLHWLGENTIF